MILSTQEFSGGASPQEIALPDLPSPNARIAFVIWGNDEQVLLISGSDESSDPRIPVGPDTGDPGVASSFSLRSAPSHILVDEDEAGTVYLSIVRV